MINFPCNDKIKKIFILSVLVLLCLFLTIFFQFILNMESIFTHFFYIPIFLSILWFGGKGFIVITALAYIIIISHIIKRGIEGLQYDMFRVIMFFLVGHFFYIMNNKISGLITNIKHNLREKEILLSEIHHRVKNNLQVITGLVGIQLARADNEATMELFNETYNRVMSMAMVHDKLYRKDDFELLNFREFLDELISHLANSYNIHKKKIIFKLEMDDIFLDINIAIPCALIINEIITNSLRHAFTKSDAGLIEINFARGENSRLSIVIGDNGEGFPDEIDIHNPVSMGLELINVLTKQLNGNIELRRNGGTKYLINLNGCLKFN